MVIGGKGLQNGEVEIKWRTQENPDKVPVNEAVDIVLKRLEERRREEAVRVPA